ncbi:hypothetical protein [Actinoallomurus liliacearum]|uniref:hypothetical protein n=1 Tax=Actinoallomurus liliacearum TaxID=1080073 RepID=UPI0031E97A0D
MALLEDPATLPAFVASTRSRAVSAGPAPHQCDAATGGLRTLLDRPAALRRIGRLAADRLARDLTGDLR